MAQDVDLLKQVPLFEGLSKGDLKKLVKSSRPEVFSPGQDIVEQGRSGGPFFLVTEGRVDVRIDDEVVKSMGPGSYFGEMALLDGGPRSATIRAESHVKAIAITSWNFLALLEENWDVCKRVMSQLSGRVRELEGAPTH